MVAVNTTELIGLLDSVGVPSDSYSIGADRDESYCLLLEHGRWKVYYSERGNRNEEASYASEEAACRRLFDWLMGDHIVRDRMRERGAK